MGYYFGVFDRRASLLRSMGSKSRFLSLMDSGVTSTSSSSAIYAIARSNVNLLGGR